MISDGNIFDMSLMGQSKPGRANSNSGHVGDAPIPTEVCVTAKFRDVPLPDSCTAAAASFDHLVGTVR
jgi:hypothetical protein